MKKLLLASAVLALSACATTRPIAVTTAADASAFAGAETVEVRLDNFDFAPKEIRLAAGKPYRLTLVNAAGGGHSFAAPDFFEAATVAPGDAALVAGGDVELDGGETKTVALIPAAGSYDLACDHFGHAALGMTGAIVVE